jgi:flagellar hook-associated protein 3 FlgL
MRVSSNSFPNLLVQELNTLTDRQSRLQSQVATGQRIQLPEDDPAAMHRVMDLEVEKRSLAQYQQNIAYLKEAGDATYSVLDGLRKISERVGEIATQADGVKSADELHAYGTEVTQLIQQAVQLMNGKLRGDALFGGTRNDRPPFVATQGPGGEVQSVTYQGNTSVNESEIAEGSLLSMQVVGANTTGTGPRGLITDDRFGADFFNHLIALQNHLNAGDSTSIASQDRPALAKDEENILYQVGTNGALQNRLDAAQALASSRSEGAENLISKDADADLAQSLVRLNQSQTAYQAALQSAATILKTSLLDYLH